MTDILMCFVLGYVWKLQWTIVVIFCLPFVFVDALFLSSNLTKLKGASDFTSIIVAFVMWLCLQSYWFSKTSRKRARKEEMEKGRLKNGEVIPLQTDSTSTATMINMDNLLCLLKESKVLKRMPAAGVFMMGTS